MNLAYIYHYYELNDQYKDNLIYFLSKSWNKNVDFFIIIAGNSKISIPKKENIHIVEVENKNHDYGGYSYLINNGLISIKKYDLYFFINSSVRGPFLPSYVESDWSEFFVNKANNGYDLIGTTINNLPSNSKYSEQYIPSKSYTDDLSHVQTTVYAITNKAFNYLIDIGFYEENKKLSKNEVIAKYEIGLTKKIKLGGFKVSSLIRPSKAFKKNYENMSCDSGDILGVKSYYCRTLNSFETMFIKTNRGLLSNNDLHSITFTSLIDSEDMIGDWDEREKLIRYLNIQLKNLRFRQKFFIYFKSLYIRFRNRVLFFSRN